MVYHNNVSQCLIPNKNMDNFKKVSYLLGTMPQVEPEIRFI